MYYSKFDNWNILISYHYTLKCNTNQVFSEIMKYDKRAKKRKLLCCLNKKSWVGHSDFLKIIF